MSMPRSPCGMRTALRDYLLVTMSKFFKKPYVLQQQRAAWAGCHYVLTITCRCTCIVGEFFAFAHMHISCTVSTDVGFVCTGEKFSYDIFFSNNYWIKKNRCQALSGVASKINKYHAVWSQCLPNSVDISVRSRYLFSKILEEHQ